MATATRCMVHRGPFGKTAHVRESPSGLPSPSHPGRARPRSSAYYNVDDLQVDAGVTLFEQLLERALEQRLTQLAGTEAHRVGEASQVHRLVEQLGDLLGSDAVVELEDALLPVLGGLGLLRQKQGEDVVALLVLLQPDAHLRVMVTHPVLALDGEREVDDVVPVTVVRKKDPVHSTSSGGRATLS